MGAENEKGRAAEDGAVRDTARLSGDGDMIKAMITDLREDVRGNDMLGASEKHVLGEMLTVSASLQNGHAEDMKTQGHAIGLLSLLMANHIIESRRRDQGIRDEIRHDVTPQTGKIERLLKALVPFRWSLAAVIISAFAFPNAATVIGAFKDLFSFFVK